MCQLLLHCPVHVLWGIIERHIEREGGRKSKEVREYVGDGREKKTLKLLLAMTAGSGVSLATRR